MKDGILEPTKDAETLMQIYNKIDRYGILKEPLTIDEQVLIFCLAKHMKEMEGKDE